MTNEPGFELHPEAANDINEIWSYIAGTTFPQPGVSAKILSTPFAGSSRFHTKAINGRI
jgi:hypothetical protein